ncbi:MULTISPECIES: CPBP family intramembrane glutamic endopeptidase [unclassified Methanoculleus]|uniref:CPBP family intramembrane glutamic endopeptidase n=1 Tax=unclassified Methanoculleus TaxID=2619537 RepID=UPI0025FEE142|nr:MULTISPECIES: CPBP family intramembrane glutamic endopeptidase [unclassified Methanoculleus]
MASSAVGHPYDPRSPSTARREVTVFLVLAFALSSIGWFFTTRSTAAEALLLSTVFTMWCPGIAAVVTRLYCQRSLEGFGFRVGEARWQMVAIFLPILVGLLIFSPVWATGIGPFNHEEAAMVFSIGFIPVFLVSIVFNLFAATGEEIGWRGLLVPEMAKFMGFTKLALLSSAIWAVWHFPLIIFSTYHGAGPLWYSLAVFVPSVMGAGFVLAWLRLRSGSVIAAVLFHGFWNYFIQQFYPLLTMETPESVMITGEFGWAAAAVYILLALVCWHFRGAVESGGARSSPEHLERVQQS